jgi:hypothetical protein
VVSVGLPYHCLARNHYHGIRIFRGYESSCQHSNCVQHPCSMVPCFELMILGHYRNIHFGDCCSHHNRYMGITMSFPRVSDFRVYSSSPRLTVIGHDSYSWWVNNKIRSSMYHQYTQDFSRRYVQDFSENDSSIFSRSFNSIHVDDHFSRTTLMIWALFPKTWWSLSD